LAVGGLLLTVASFYLIMKIAGLVDALGEKVKEMKLWRTVLPFFLEGYFSAIHSCNSFSTWI